MSEERPIPSCPGYAATSDGKIISLERTLPDGRHWRRNMLRPQQNGKWYCIVGVGKKVGTRFVHRLVLEAFVGPCPEGMEACHNNGNPRDNRIENLRWDTHKENCKDAVQHGTSPGLWSDRVGEKNGRSKLKELDIRWIRYLYKAGILQKDLAKVYGVRQTQISNIICRKRWKCISEMDTWPI